MQLEKLTEEEVDFWNRIFRTYNDRKSVNLILINNKSYMTIHAIFEQIKNIFKLYKLIISYMCVYIKSIIYSHLFVKVSDCFSYNAMTLYC